MYIHENKAKGSIPVDEIVMKVGPPLTKFQPKHISDFEKNALYLVMTAQGAKDNQVHNYKVVIGRMYGKCVRREKLNLHYFFLWEVICIKYSTLFSRAEGRVNILPPDCSFLAIYGCRQSLFH